MENRRTSVDRLQRHDLVARIQATARRDALIPSGRRGARIVFFSSVACTWASCAFFERRSASSMPPARSAVRGRGKLPLSTSRPAHARRPSAEQGPRRAETCSRDAPAPRSPCSGAHRAQRLLPASPAPGPSSSRRSPAESPPPPTASSSASRLFRRSAGTPRSAWYRHALGQGGFPDAGLFGHGHCIARVGFGRSARLRQRLAHRFRGTVFHQPPPSAWNSATVSANRPAPAPPRCASLYRCCELSSVR